MASIASGRDIAADGDGAAVWEIARPRWPRPVGGVEMAGFRDRSAGAVEMRSVPHPFVTLILEFGDSLLAVDGARGRPQGGLVAGLAAGAVRIRGRNTACVEVRLSPLAAHAVLGNRLAELDHGVCALDDVWGREAVRIRERLGEIRSWEERFVFTEAVLARRDATGPAADPEVAWAWNRIVGSGGLIRVAELAAEVGWSRKRLWTRFGSQIGLPPKSAAKLVRFDNAAHRLAAGASAARVAAECGYADQSHLNRDVMAFTAGTPAALAADAGFAADHAAYRE